MPNNVEVLTELPTYSAVGRITLVELTPEMQAQCDAEIDAAMERVRQYINTWMWNELKGKDQ